MKCPGRILGNMPADPGQFFQFFFPFRFRCFSALRQKGFGVPGREVFDRPQGDDRALVKILILFGVFVPNGFNFFNNSVGTQLQQAVKIDDKVGNGRHVVVKPGIHLRAARHHQHQVGKLAVDLGHQGPLGPEREYFKVKVQLIFERALERHRFLAIDLMNNRGKQDAVMFFPDLPALSF